MVEILPVVALDLGIGNIGSLLQAFARIGIQVVATDDPEEVLRAEAIIIPGVGSFADGAAALTETGLGDAVLRAAGGGRTPIVGICLGFQLLSDTSEENGKHAGLGLIPGRTVRLTDSTGVLRVPNIGWCDVNLVTNQTVVPQELDGQSFYFAHSYHVECRDSADVVMKFAFGEAWITAAARHRNVFGVQFHPELSQNAGLDCLQAVMSWASASASGASSAQR